MKKYRVEVLLISGERIKLSDVEASSEDDAIDRVSDVGTTYVTFNDKKSFFKIYRDHIVGYEVNERKQGERPISQKIRY